MPSSRDNANDKPLTEILSIQLKLLEELYCLLERETREFGDMNLDAVAELNRLMEELTERIEAHTGLLSQAISAAACELGLAPDATLWDVVAKTTQKAIPGLYRELDAAAQRVQGRAVMNREIAERFAATAASTMSFLTRLIQQSSVYGASGGYQQRLVGSVMINRKA
ncbi:MAG: flagellar export chaperone FlgN [Oryzomonas sp.]